MYCRYFMSPMLSISACAMISVASVHLMQWIQFNKILKVVFTLMNFWPKHKYPFLSHPYLPRPPWLMWYKYKWSIDILLKIDWLMAHITCPVVNVSLVSDPCKNIDCQSGHIYWPGLSALSANLPCQPTCLVLCPLVATFLKWIFYEFKMHEIIFFS